MQLFKVYQPQQALLTVVLPKLIINSQPSEIIARYIAYPPQGAMILNYTFTAVPCSISQQHQNSMMEYEIQAQTLSPAAR
jgi:hypothetical protein